LKEKLNSGRFFVLVRFETRSQNCEKRQLASSCLSFRMKKLGSHWTDFHQILYSSAYRRTTRIIISITSTLHEDQYTFLLISRSILLRIRNVSDKFVEKIKTHILCSITGFRNFAFYEIMWKIFAEPARPQTTIWRLRVAYWIPEATDAHSEYVILIAFPLQQWFHERAWMLCYTYIACLVVINLKYFLSNFVLLQILQDK